MSHVELISGQQRLPSVRGLVLLQNARGRAFTAVDVMRWLRLSRLGFQTRKIDVFLRGEAPTGLEPLLERGEQLDARISLRTACAQPPPDLGALKQHGLLDVFLSPPDVAAPAAAQWLDAAKESGLAVRLQVQAPFSFDADAAAHLAERWHETNVVAVNIALVDPFLAQPPCRDGAHSETTVVTANRLAHAVAAQGIETNLLFWPESLVEPENRVHLVTARQFSNDHQQYEAEAYALAACLNHRGPTVARLVLLMLLNQYTSYRNPIDSALFPWLINRPWLHARAWALHKVTRYWRRRNRSRAESTGEGGLVQGFAKQDRAVCPESLPDRSARQDRGGSESFSRLMRIGKDAGLGTDTSRSLRRSLASVPQQNRAECAEGFSRTLTGLSFEPSDEPSRYPSREQPKYLDEVDRDRLHFSETLATLAEEARQVVNNRPPTRELDSFEYAVEGQAMMQMPGGNRWFSFTNTEKLSTPLARLEPPFTIAVTIGGGSADYIGFGFGRQRKVLCPMEAYVHKLVLHVSEDGRYVLLRDDVPMRPEVLERGMYTPARLGGVLEPQISIWNIDGSVVTQAVQLWEGAPERPASRDIRFSVVMVCTRYARRMQAALKAVAAQRGVPLDSIEVIVAYVPGVDATDDILDSMGLVHSALRIVRSPFPPQNVRSKGLLINESVRMASGEWTILLDADIIVPPDLFARLAEAPGDVAFAAPEGRKLLSRETTARILLGELDPHAEWDALFKGPGEYRLRETFGVPIGYCQCVRTKCLETVKYEEHEHFEGADYRFAVDMEARFGKAQRLDGVSVLHLDHAGSQWYGTGKQF